MVEASEPASFSLRLKRETSGALAWWRRNWGKRWFRLLAYAGVALLIGYAAVWLIFARDLPDAEKLKTYQPPLPTYVRGYDGAPIHSYARERRVELRYDEFPPLLVRAFLAAEDKTFFSHGGLDYPGLAGAVFDYVTKVGSGQRAKGGSTITQQVAKNLLLGNEYSVRRKIREAILARRIEDVLTKQEILELYLNQIPLGRNSFGVQAAARAYFNKDLAELTLSEFAFLAILPKAPETYGRARNVEKAMSRRNFVLSEMLRNDFIDEAQHRAAAAAPLGILPRSGTTNLDVGGYFIEEVRRSLIAQFGETAENGPYSVYAGGLWVRTSLDPKLQGYAEQALRGALVRFEGGRGWTGPIRTLEGGEGWRQQLASQNLGAGMPDWRVAMVLSKSPTTASIGFADGSTGTLPNWGATMPKRGTGTSAFNAMQPGDVIAVKAEGNAWVLRSIPEISGGMVVQDPHSGRVLAMQGGFDSRLATYNRATQALRQPGSTFKPFVYAAALDAGMTPAEIIVDGPFCVYQSARLGRKCFRNFGNAAGAGPKTMRWGLEQSRNLMTVRAASQTGMDSIVRLSGNVGISKPGTTYPAVLAIALGAGETTVLDLVNAYSVLASNGIERRPTMIDFVQDRSGKVRFRSDTRQCERCNLPDWDGRPMPRPAARSKQLMDAQSAYQVVHMLEGVVQRGTAVALRDMGRPLFGKTGTTSGPTNVWFVGGSADMVAGVYLGYDQPRNMGGYAQGGTVAVPIFKEFAAKAMAGMPVVPFRAPPGIRMVRIDRMSGKRVFGPWPGSDPKSAVIWEAFKPESEPRRSIRRDELEEPAKKKTKAKAAQQGSSGQNGTQRPDSDFLQREGGIY